MIQELHAQCHPNWKINIKYCEINDISQLCETSNALLWNNVFIPQATIFTENTPSTKDVKGKVTQSCPTLRDPMASVEFSRSG